MRCRLEPCCEGRLAGSPRAPRRGSRPRPHVISRRVASAWWRPGVVDRAWADDLYIPSAPWGALEPSGRRHLTPSPAAPEKIKSKGFADTQDDDMGFVEVDLTW